MRGCFSRIHDLRSLTNLRYITLPRTASRKVKRTKTREGSLLLPVQMTARPFGGLPTTSRMLSVSDVSRDQSQMGA
jgi:hypothetical protein